MIYPNKNNDLSDIDEDQLEIDDENEPVVKPYHPTKSANRRYLFPPLRELKYFLLRYPQKKKANRRDPDSSVARILIVGRNYSSNLCLARSFGQTGYEVEVLRTYKIRRRWRSLLIPEAYSRYVKAYHACVLWSDEELLIRKLLYLADPDRKMLLIPSDDQAVDIIDRYYDELSDHYLIPNIGHKAGEISKAMDKQWQKEEAKRFGIPVAKGCIVKVADGKYTLPETISYPCFVKPNLSIQGKKTRMQVCENSDELNLLLSSYIKDTELLVEDYLSIKKEYSLLGLSTGTETVMPGFFVADEGGHHSHRGVALLGTVLSPEPYQELFDRIKDLVASLDYQGLFDVDLIETEDGSFYFAEINFRYGGSGYAITASGLNLPGMFADYMLKAIPIDTSCKLDRYGQHFLSEMIMYDEYRFHYLENRSDMKKRKEEAQIRFIYDENDKGPYGHFVLMNELLLAKTRIGRLKRKLFSTKEKRHAGCRILICGLNYGTNLCLARSFGEAGYPVEILRIFWEKRFLREFLCPEAFSRYVRKYHTIHASKDKSALLQKLLKLADPEVKTLLVPADDLIVAFTDEYYDILSQHYVIPHVAHTAGMLTHFMHKDIQKEIARKHGLPVAESRIVSAEKIDESLSEIAYPCFLKPVISADQAKALSCKCENENELRTVVQEASMPGTSFLVEEYLDIANEYSFLGMSVEGEAIIPVMLEIDHGGHGERLGVALSGIVRSSSHYQETVRKLIAFVKEIGFEGLFDIDMIETTDHVLYFLEMNFRYGASGRALDGCGLDLPGLLADHLLEGIELPAVYKLEEGLRFLNDRVLTHEYVTGYLSKQQMDELKQSADYSFFQDKKDPWPYRYFRFIFLFADLARRLYARIR